MQFSLENQTASLSVGEFADFAIGPRESGGGPQGLWRAQLGQHWHNELKAQVEQTHSSGGTLPPNILFEVPIDGRLAHRGWTFTLTGRIDQLIGERLREIKTVTRPLPAEESVLRTDYPAYFLQLAAYAVLRRTSAAALPPADRVPPAELIFVETGSGLTQTIALTPFDEALVFHQLDAIVEFLNLRRTATARRRSLQFRPAFSRLRPGQETIQQDLRAAFGTGPAAVMFEAPTGYGKTGCVLEFALGQLKSGRFERLIWLTGKSTGQLHVVATLRQMTAPLPGGLLDYQSGLPFWQVRNKAEHCVNHTFHCVRDGCDYLNGCSERWPQSGLAKFYLDDRQPRELENLRAAGREARICPYEITRTALAFNDVWIGDFNYVFAPDNRGLFYDQPGFDPAATLLVVDEAHNLPSRVAGAHSHRARDHDARQLLAELDHLRAPAKLVLAVEEWARLLAALRPADELEPGQEDEVRELVAKLANLVGTEPLDYTALGPRHSETLWQFGALGEFLNDTTLVKLLWVAREGELEFTCVDAAATIGGTLRGFGGVLLMSATLQPWDNMAVSCGLDTNGGSGLARARPDVLSQQSPAGYARLQAQTPWRAGAYDVAVDVRVETTFRERRNYYGTTAATIEAMHGAANSRHTAIDPEAYPLKCIAVFFPSYAYAEAIQSALAGSSSLLRVALQPRLPDLAAQATWVEESLRLADVLFLVLGSSFAEGIDLLGGRITHAMVVSPALPEVNAVQKARQATLRDLGREQVFRRVYQIPGLQKVNQALGRLVRSPGHKAKVLLHCLRFADPTYASLLAADYQFYREIDSATALHDWLRK